jgi:hypothetical protein
MRARLDVLLSCLAIAATASADPRSLTVVPHPLEFDPRPELTALSDKLKGAWIEAIREAGQVVTPSRKEIDSALAEVGRKDCRISNDCLSALAVKGAGLYAAHATLELTGANVFVVNARVVRDDGKLMSSFTAQHPRVDPKKKPLLAQVKDALTDAVKGLGVQGLPAFKEASSAPPVEPVKPPVASVETPAVTEPPPPPPVLPPAGPPGRKIAGYTLIGVGGAVAIAGGALLLVAQAQARALMVDQRGFLPSSDSAALEQAKAANLLHTLGLVGLGVGVGCAVAGLVVAFFTADAPEAVTFGAAPTGDGLLLTVGGALP